MPSPIEEIITKLSESEEPLAGSRLVELSHLTLQEISLLENAWDDISPLRRRQLLTMLVELAEVNPKLDFNHIFRNRLSDRDEEVRSKAIEGLWECEDTGLINTFIDLLEHDGSETVQAAAAQTLGQYALMGELDRLRSDDKAHIGRTLLDIFGDENRALEVRRRALESLSPLSLSETNPAIDRAYDSGGSMRISAIYAMGRTCDPAWLDILLEEIDSTDAEIRYEVCQACGEIGESEAIPYLARLIEDPDPEVQMVAIQALGKIGGTKAKEILKDQLENPNDNIKKATQETLDELISDEDPFSLQY